MHTVSEKRGTPACSPADHMPAASSDADHEPRSHDADALATISLNFYGKRPSLLMRNKILGLATMHARTVLSVLPIQPSYTNEEIHRGASLKWNHELKGALSSTLSVL